MEKLNTGVEYPAGLFNALKTNLQISKGALLLPEKDGGTLAPWCVTGYDKTTRHRMRIPLSKLYDVFRKTGSSMIFADKQEVKDILPYFSSRESALVARVFMMSFKHNGKIIALLLVTESPYMLLDETLLRTIFSVAGELSAPMLFAAREARMRKTRETPAVRKEDFVSEFQNSERKELFVLDAEPLIRAIREYSPDLDEYRVFEDITGIVSTIMAGSPVLPAPERARLLFLAGNDGPDSKLLIHQLSLAIRKIFLEIKDIPAIGIRPISLSPDNPEPRVLVDSLLA